LEDEEEELETQKKSTQPKFKCVDSARDQAKVSKTRNGKQGRGPILHEKSAIPTQQARKAKAPASKVGGARQKLRSVSNFYSADEDQGHSVST
jgi:hypothetical protein